MGRRAGSAQLLLDSLFSEPVITSKAAAKKLDLTPKATNKMIEDFIAGDVLKEITGLQRGRVYAFHNYLKLFEK